MARVRYLKPGFFKNEILGTSDPFVSLLFAGLWTLADKSGILEDRPLRIKAELFPYRENFDINRYLTVLIQEGFIHRYEVDGLSLLQIEKFKEHQHTHHTEKNSIYPDYSDTYKVTVKEPLNTSYDPSYNLNTYNLKTYNLPSSAAKKKAVAVPDETELQEACKKTWIEYSNAFKIKYGTAPVRNKAVNSKIKAFVQRIGFNESPQVAAWYVSSSDRYYVQKAHGVGPLLADAEKLRMEWATGRNVVATDFKTAAERRNDNIDKAVAEFLGDASNPSEIVIEGELSND